MQLAKARVDKVAACEWIVSKLRRNRDADVLRFIFRTWRSTVSSIPTSSDPLAPNDESDKIRMLRKRLDSAETRARMIHIMWRTIFKWHQNQQRAARAGHHVEVQVDPESSVPPLEKSERTRKRSSFPQRHRPQERSGKARSPRPFRPSGLAIAPPVPMPASPPRKAPSKANVTTIKNQTTAAAPQPQRKSAARALHESIVATIASRPGEMLLWLNLTNS